MSRAKVLAFIARELRREGGILTPSSLSAYAEIEAVGERLDLPASGLAAAVLAVLLPQTENSIVQAEFSSQAACTFERLQPRGPHSTAGRALSAHQETEVGELLHDAAIATMLGEAMYLQDSPGSSLPLLDEMLRSEEEPARKALIREVRGRLQEGQVEHEPRVSETGGRLLSISFDICGSTSAKSRMRACARNVTELTEWYQQFYEGFLRSEFGFYESLFRPREGQSPLDWRRAFVVKGIGDELWLLYEISDEDLRRLPSLAVPLLQSALDLANSTITWFPARDDDGEESADDAWESKILPFKVYIDLIENAVEISMPRRDFLLERIPAILGSPLSRSQRDFAQIGNRLNAATLIGDQRRWVASVRTDYLGWEVDRFFRASKSAIPCVVTVGDALFEEISNTPGDGFDRVGGTELRRTVIECALPGGHTRYDHSFLHLRHELCPSLLKGLDAPYCVYHVLRKRDLNELRSNGVDEEMMKPTWELFTAAMEQAVR